MFFFQVRNNKIANNRLTNSKVQNFTYTGTLYGYGTVCPKNPIHFYVVSIL